MHIAEKRREILKKIIATLEKLQSQGYEIKGELRENLINEISLKEQCSIRTADEYIDEALMKVNYKGTKDSLYF